jgi:gamma-glutamylcyclotransferase (GGCT)/AIG2-like uncharacterized protein YtfP
MKTTPVAVYGTLKKGYRNYERLLPGREPIFRGFVSVPYRLYGTPEYPMLVPVFEKHPVLVEIFELEPSKLEELDALEEPYSYWRETVQLQELGRSVEIYVHAAPAPEGFEPVASGEWTG